MNIEFIFIFKNSSQLTPAPPPPLQIKFINLLYYKVQRKQLIVWYQYKRRTHKRRKYLRSTTSAFKDIGIKLFDLVEFNSWTFFKQSSIQNLPSPTFFVINVPVRRLYWSDICTSPTFILVRRLYQSYVCKSDVCYQSDVCTGPTFVPVQRLYQSNVCTSTTFVPVRRLYQSDVCTGKTLVSPTFVLSDLCGVRRLCVRRLYYYRQFLKVFNFLNPTLSP